MKPTWQKLHREFAPSGEDEEGNPLAVECDWTEAMALGPVTLVRNVVRGDGRDYVCLAVVERPLGELVGELDPELETTPPDPDAWLAQGGPYDRYGDDVRNWHMAMTDAGWGYSTEDAVDLSKPWHNVFWAHGKTGEAIGTSLAWRLWQAGWRPSADSWWNHKEHERCASTRALRSVYTCSHVPGADLVKLAAQEAMRKADYAEPHAQHLREGGWTFSAAADVWDHVDSDDVLVEEAARALYDAGARWSTHGYWVALGDDADFHKIGTQGTTTEALAWLKERTS
jgi:hypothetical protein